MVHWPNGAELGCVEQGYIWWCSGSVWIEDVKLSGLYLEMLDRMCSVEVECGSLYILGIYSTT